jgi:hypothetical protein
VGDFGLPGPPNTQRVPGGDDAGARSSSPPRIGGPGGPNVVVFSGHLTDEPDRPRPRFPEDLEAAARRGIAEALDWWSIGPNDLGICGGARGGDILFAELCVEREAQVLLCVALPPERFLETSVRAEGTDWETRFWALMEHSSVTVEIAAWPIAEDPDDAFIATNHRLVEVAKDAGGADGFLALLLWDEFRGRPRPGGTSHFARLVEGIARQVVIVNPRRL